jgi:hypothetical protein
MIPVLLLALAAAPEPTVPAGAIDVRKVEFDLGRYRPSPPPDCGSPAAAADILVCGRRPATAYPLDKMARQFEAGPTDAETGLFGSVRGGAYVERHAFSNGMEANRIMFGIKLPF